MEKKSLPVMRLEPPTACMQIMYDNPQTIEVIPNRRSFLSLHTSIILICPVV